jgi:hypothetical protein
MLRLMHSCMMVASRIVLRYPCKSVDVSRTSGMNSMLDSEGTNVSY